MVKGIKKIKEYFDTHYTAYFVLVMALAILTMLIVFQSYLKKEYLDYLTERNYETESDIIESLQRNVNYSMRELINNGSEIATNTELYYKILELENCEKESTKQYRKYLDLYTKLQGYDYMRKIDSVAVVGKEGLVCSYDRYRGTKKVLWNIKDKHYVEEMADTLLSSTDGGFPRYRVFEEPREYVSYPGKKIFHVAYPLTGGKVSIWEAEYVLVITYDMSVFSEFITTVNVPKVEYIRGYIADEDGNIIYYNNDSYIGEDESVILNGKSIRHITKEIGYFGWTLNIIIDEKDMQEHVNVIYRKGLLFYSVLLLIYLIVVALVFQHLLQPVNRIRKSLKETEKGNYNTRIQVTGKHEIWQLAAEYNRMMDAIEMKNREIEQQHRENLSSIEQQHQAEREALESQISAHFICNTLGCINYEAIEAGNYQVAVLIKKLSNILRYTFDQKCQDVYMEQEMAWLEQYLFLQKTRFETKFDYSIELPEAYGQWPCCKLMFQPFVENSILHGFEGVESGGIIRIYAMADGERLKIILEDNGSGIDEQRAAVIQEILEKKGNMHFGEKNTVGIGIRNVVTRMRMYYGKNFDIEMITEIGQGTRFIFWIPIPEKYEQNYDGVDVLGESYHEDYNC